MDNKEKLLDIVDQYESYLLREIDNTISDIVDEVMIDCQEQEIDLQGLLTDANPAERLLVFHILKSIITGDRAI